MKIKVLKISYSREDHEAGRVGHFVSVETRPSTPDEAADQKTTDDKDNAARFMGAIQQVVGAAVHEWSKQNEIQVDQEALEFAIHSYIERVNAKATAQ